jgi:hypothetical protein
MKMEKQLSKAAQETIFVKNRVKAKELVDGARVLYFGASLTGQTALYLGEVCRCDTCPNVGVVNAGKVDARITPESALLAFPFIHSKLFVGEEIGCYDADGSGDVLCPACVEKRESQK